MPEAVNDRPTPEREQFVRLLVDINNACMLGRHRERQALNAALMTAIDDLERERKAALARVEALRPYLQHTEWCGTPAYGQALVSNSIVHDNRLPVGGQGSCVEFNYERICTCGLDAAMTPAPMALERQLAELRKNIRDAKAEIAAGNTRMLPYLEGWVREADRLAPSSSPIVKEIST